MFKKLFCLLLLVSLGGVSLSPAQESPPVPSFSDDEVPNRLQFWQVTLTGGHFMVALDKIVSVSRHKYLLDTALIVDEVTIDTQGEALARFYFITPITDKAPGNTIPGAAARGNEMVEGLTQKVGVDVQNMVMKKYPETTHAKTIEYRLLDEKILSSLYTSVQNAWATGKGRHFKTK